MFQRREKEKKALQVMTLTTVTRGPDVELATLRELPRRGNFVHNTNALYTTADIPTDEEIALLPHIRRDQITLTKFLGSGAFGEVFEGIARNLANSGGGETRVAIKVSNHKVSKFGVFVSLVHIHSHEVKLNDCELSQIICKHSTLRLEVRFHVLFMFYHPF